jgi:hypothetical protein
VRPVPLTVINGGISRLRIKGGARADTLYDLLNGYVTAAQTVHVRPGSRRLAVLNSATKGVCAFSGSLHTFSSTVVGVPDGYTLHVLTHPDSSIDPAPVISVIHFAAPFLGFLYVVAEFDNGDTFHYWLRVDGTWAADTIYHAGDIVIPTDPAGISFKATRNGSPLPSWAPRVPRTVGDLIEPTVYNDFYYEVIDTVGANPASGDTEPNFPTEEGAQVSEDADGLQTGSSAVTQPPDNSTGPAINDRYGNDIVTGNG